MRKTKLALIGCLLACAAAQTFAQSSIDRSFKVVSKDCKGLQWSAEALERHPRIGQACQAVEERDGKAYVLFQGQVVSNNSGGQGREVTVDFKDGARLTLTPPANSHVYLNGRRTPVTQLRRGDELNFYVPEDRLTAQFYAADQTPATTTEFVAAPIVEQDAVQEDDGEQMAAALPSTASDMPIIAICGLLTISLGAALTVRRRRRR